MLIVIPAVYSSEIFWRSGSLHYGNIGLVNITYREIRDYDRSEIRYKAIQCMKYMNTLTNKNTCFRCILQVIVLQENKSSPKS